MWTLIFVIGVGLFAAWVYFIQTPDAIRACEAVRVKMPTKQVEMEAAIRGLQQRKAWVGAVVIVQTILTIVLSVSHLWR